MVFIEKQLIPIAKSKVIIASNYIKRISKGKPVAVKGNIISYNEKLEINILSINSVENDIYKNYENGILGFFEKKDKLSFINKPFMVYSDQRASFNNSEYRGSKNLAFGFKKKIETENFNASIGGKCEDYHMFQFLYQIFLVVQPSVSKE